MYAGGVSQITIGLGGYDNSLWQFTPSGDSGQRASVYFNQESSFNQLIRTINGLYGTHTSGGFILRVVKLLKLMNVQ